MVNPNNLLAVIEFILTAHDERICSRILGQRNMRKNVFQVGHRRGIEACGADNEGSGARSAAAREVEARAYSRRDGRRVEYAVTLVLVRDGNFLRR